MDSVLIMWLLLIGIFLVVEVITLGLTTVWFAGGAFVAFVANLFHCPLWIQVVLFFIVSVLLLFVVRPSACRRFNSKRMKTNIESLIGSEGKVTQTIDNFNQKGCVFIEGKEWTARSLDTSVIPEGEKVTIVEITGVKLIVERKNKSIT